MVQPTIAPQKQFASLDDFIKGQNNYYAHFLEGNWGQTRRNHPHFRRFQGLYPEMERKLRSEVTAARNQPGQQMPYTQLFESYKLMSQLVFADDPGVMQYSHPDMYLIG
ncbi:hypothetical protein HYU40_03835 [Candidatus Woesearchaeota archaeon]|nr:hypothetical protein [Candidatus Woesearchaeota archaeon]